MPTFAAGDLKQLIQVILEASGTPEQSARHVADSLIDANLAGHDSHGVIRVLQYLEEVEKGALDPKAEPEMILRDGGIAVVDGKWGWGQVAMLMATREVVDRARETGIGLATVTRCYHIGRVAPYVEEITNAQMVGLAMANANPAVAPYGGRSRVMGTNPIAWAVPRAGEKAPIALDVATAQVAEGKLRVAKAKGVPVPPGAVVNVEGAPSIDPNDFYDGGALMAFGGHKGSGFSILAQLLGRGIAGMHQERLAGHRGANGPVIIAIDVARIVPIDSFLQAVEDQSTAICAAMPAEGFDEVLLPGQPELAERTRREVDGIPVPEQTWKELLALANSLGVPTDRWLANHVPVGN
jgi:LDH2 family malate/lactate/ureidoglycolate dehydrogenase